MNADDSGGLSSVVGVGVMNMHYIETESRSPVGTD